MTQREFHPDSHRAKEFMSLIYNVLRRYGGGRSKGRRFIANAPKKQLTRSLLRYRVRSTIQMGRLRSAIVRAHLSIPASYFELRLIR